MSAPKDQPATDVPLRDPVTVNGARVWRARIVFLGVWAAGAVLSAHYLRRGWVPHDSGTLAQSADRLLHGELPHRDFDEIYTGGLSALHALAFRLFGETLVSMRLVLFAAFVAFLPAVYYVARRFVSPTAATLIMLVAAAWTVPNYSAPVPSWYNLFFAVFGTAALCRFVEDERRLWLALAGVAGGLSLLVKTPGLYFIAAALVFLVYYEHTLPAPSTAATTAGSSSRPNWFTLLTLAAIAALGIAVTLLVRLRAGVAGLVTFVAPVVVLLTVVGARLLSGRSGAPRMRLARLAALLWPFAAGAVVPVIVFVIPYAASGSLGALWSGVFVLPTKRFVFAAMDLPPLWTFVYGAAVVGAFWWSRSWPAGGRRSAAILVGAGLLLLLARSRHAIPYEAVWYGARALLPLSVCAGALLLGGRLAPVTLVRDRHLAIVLVVTAMCALVQFPFAAPIYFCYVAPLALLSAVAVTSTWDARPQPMAAVTLVFLLVFALLRINPGFIYGMGVHYVRDWQTEPLALARAGVLVTPEDKSTYEGTVAAVRAHAAGDYIWAGPDAPEVYFLAGKRNPTRTLFDFFDSPGDRAARVLEAIDRHAVSVVVLHSRPPFSGPLPRALRDSLERRFPRSEVHGWFQVRWRE